jgi:hypothetical protein
MMCVKEGADHESLEDNCNNQAEKGSTVRLVASVRM